ncbi:hypothetical protein [Paraferrimonas sedimenticola]|uniref:Uncharacterized protein n=1 Tax=Paraferrimonas sedimenticola TaxID=375674 RepID=A0AA37VXY8_9GAMM|nr:hypothetical protein [Paraferrimonas sedimenticola]GLP96699.1 hypothetical protein GCM10007895_20050 [Paraferrimonas sedimenticola]
MYFDGSIPTGEVERLIDDSYLLVVAKLNKVQRQAVLALLPEANQTPSGG